MSVLDQATQERLEAFRASLASLPNESAKTHAFMALVGQLFPASNIVAKLAGGMQKTVRIREGRRVIDSYFGNAVIEFEKSLDVSLEVAVAQLREQAAGLWNGEENPERGLLCVASDGLRWETYQAVLTAPVEGRQLGPEDVHLEPLQTIQLTPDNLSAFWLWLTGLLFRDAQVLPTAERFRLDFGSLSPAFLSAMRKLREAWDVVGAAGEARVAFEAWRRYLTVTYGSLADSGQEVASPETVELFLKHTFLAMIARLLVWAALSKGKAPEGLGNAIEGALSGSYFHRKKIENLVESDFFQWAAEPPTAAIVRPAWEGALGLILTYDLSQLSHDVLKGVYQELVDPKDRHDLGEYYTPEWLCTRLVDEMMPDTGIVSVLDPTCGSGSFLRAAIAHLIDHNPEMDQAELLAAILENVVGIDIHPLAVTIARATYVLALRDLVSSTDRPIHLPVYLADALFLPKEIHQSLLNGRETEIRFGLSKDYAIYLPSQILESGTQFDSAIRLSAAVAADHAERGRETPSRLQRYLGQRVPGFSALLHSEVIVEALWDFVEKLAELIRKQENSIWAFVIVNGYRPALMKNRFDLILGNPPWLSYRYISDPAYQAEVKERAIVEYAIAPSHVKLFTQMELATVFLMHALSTFGKEGARLAFVMPRSVLTADQHEPLRRRDYNANVALTGYWDFMHVRPLFNVPACVLFAKKITSKDSKGPGKPLPVSIWSGRLPNRNMDWAGAKALLDREETTGNVISMGKRTAFSTLKEPPKTGVPGVYLDRFLNGATIYPRNFYFISDPDAPQGIRPDSVYWVQTDEEQAREAKPPYKEIRMSGRVDGGFLFRTAISKHILPFAVLAPAYVALPVVTGVKGIKVVSSEQLADSGHRDFSRWMRHVEEHWNRHRGNKSDRMTVYEWLDYNGKLTSQDLSLPYLVLYNAAGTNISAAVFSRKDCPGTFFVDHKLYYYATRSRAEANYLAAILNASVVNELIKPFQSVGLQGERDIHKKVLELPIPLFDAKTPEHVALAKLGAEAGRQAKKVSAERGEGWPAGLARRRAIVRENLADVLGRIDEAVKALFEVRKS